LIHVGFAHENGACIVESLDGWGVDVGVAVERGAGTRGGEACNIDVVFDCKWNAPKWAS